MCVCKQTYPPYVYTRLCNVNRHGTRWLIKLLAERAPSALDGFGLCLSSAGAWHAKAIAPGRPSVPRYRLRRRCPSPAAAPWPPPAHRSWERLRSGHLHAHFRIGKQNRSSECTAERGQRNPPVGEQQRGAPGTSCPRRQPARGGGAGTSARGAVSPRPPLHQAPAQRGARGRHGAAATATRTAPAECYRSQSNVDAV